MPSPPDNSRQASGPKPNLFRTAFSTDSLSAPDGNRNLPTFPSKVTTTTNTETLGHGARLSTRLKRTQHWTYRCCHWLCQRPNGHTARGTLQGRIHLNECDDNQPYARRVSHSMHSGYCLVQRRFLYSHTLHANLSTKT
jgi:hypothetical protein